MIQRLDELADQPDNTEEEGTDDHVSVGEVLLIPRLIGDNPLDPGLYE